MVYSTMTSSVPAPYTDLHWESLRFSSAERTGCGSGWGVVHSFGGGVWVARGGPLFGWSRVDLEGQELLRVHVVERAQVGEFQEQFGEDGDLVGMILGDQTAKSSNQRLLERLD